MKAPLSYVPTLPVALGLVAGIIFTHNGLFYLALFAGIALFGVLYATGRHYWSGAAIAMAIGASIAWFRTPAPFPSLYESAYHRVSATVESVSERRSTQRCVLRIDSIDGRPTAHVLAVAYVSNDDPNLGQGARVSLLARIFPVDDNPSLVPHETDYERYLAYEGIQCRMQAKPGSLFVTTPPTGLSAMVNRVRNGMYDGIVTSPISAGTASFLLACILGDRAYIDDMQTASFRATGISHIMALSGLHVGILASMLSFMLIPIRGIRHGAFYKTAITLVLIWFYAIVTGMGPSVLRASTMITILLLAQLIQRGSNVFNSLCLSVIVLLSFNPMSLFTPGFQLTFAAVLSILVFAPLVPTTLQRRPALYYAINLFVIPISAMLGTGLISAYYFNCFPWLFLVANIVTAILFPFLLGGGVILMLLTMAGLRLRTLGAILNALYLAIDRSVDWFASLHAFSDGIFFSAWAIAPYAIAVGLLAWGLYRVFHPVDYPHFEISTRSIFGLSALALCIAIALIAWVKEPMPTAELYVPMGQPSAMIVRTGTEARLVPLDRGIDPQQLLQDYNDRFRAFLLSRECGDGFRYMQLGEQLGPFYYDRGCLVMGDSAIAIINDNAPVRVNIPISYAIVAKGFTGPAQAITQALNIPHTPHTPSHTPSRLFFTPALSHNRIQRLQRELADSLPDTLSTTTLGKQTFRLTAD